MRTVEYRGDPYLLLKRSGESSLVRDPETGDERYLPNDELTATGDSPLTVAARTVPTPQRRLLTAVHSEQILGLLVELADRGPLSVRELLRRVGELRAAGLVREADVAGERGYETTEMADEALSALR